LRRQEIAANADSVARNELHRVQCQLRPPASFFSTSAMAATNGATRGPQR